MESVLLESAYSAHNGDDDRLITVARRYRIDVEKIERSVRDEFTAKAKKATSKGQKQQPKPNATAAAV